MRGKDSIDFLKFYKHIYYAVTVTLEHNEVEHIFGCLHSLPKYAHPRTIFKKQTISRMSRYAVFMKP